MCDIVLMLWMVGWVGMVGAVVLDDLAVMPALFLAAWAPDLYYGLRRWLHRRGLLRCDWLPILHH